MPTPYLITTNVNLPRQAQHTGPFEIGTDLYVAAYDESGATDRVRMYKSTNDGATWSEQDSSNAPVCYKASTHGRRSIDIQQSGSILYVGYLEVGGTFNIVEFSSGTWGATITGGPLIGNVSNPIGVNNCFVRRASGDYLALWGINSGGGILDIRGQVYSGGAWGVAFTVSTDVGDLVGACVDSTGRTYIVMTDQVSFQDNKIVCRTYTYPGNVLSPADVIITEDLISLGTYTSLPSTYTPTNGVESVGLAYSRGVRYPWELGFQTTQGHIAYATAVISDAPVFTVEEVNYLNTPVGEPSSQLSDISASTGSGEPTVFWITPTYIPRGIVYNMKDSCSLEWGQLNTELINIITNSSFSGWDYVDSVHASYLSARAKHGILISASVSSDYRLYYMELAV